MQQSAPLKNYETKMNTARTEIKAEQDAVAPLLTAVDDRSYWVRIIDDIHERLPKEYIWVTSFAPVSADSKAASGGPGKPGPKINLAGPAQPTGGTILMLKGLYLYNPRQTAVVDDFVAKLKGSPIF